MDFIVLIHPTQWTIVNPVGADWPATCQKKPSCLFTGWAGPVLYICQVAHHTSCLDRATSSHLFCVVCVLCVLVTNAYSCHPLVIKFKTNMTKNSQIDSTDCRLEALPLARTLEKLEPTFQTVKVTPMQSPPVGSVKVTEPFIKQFDQPNVAFRSRL